MRYKARTDLERVYDVINGYNFDEKSKDIIERQLKSINLYDFKRKNNLLGTKKEINKRINSKILTSKSLLNHKKKKMFDIYKNSNIYYIPKKDIYKPWQRREDLNNEACSLLSSYHHKTHFKAAEEIAESNYKNNKNNKNLNSVFLLPNLLPNFYKPKHIKTENASREKEDPFHFSEEENSSAQSEDYEEFDKNYNPIMQKSKSIYDPETMKTLTKIAFKQKKGTKGSTGQFDYKGEGDEDEDNKNLVKIKFRHENKKYTEDNNIIVNNKLYYKNSQFDKITNEVLEMCKVYSTKSKFNNTVHKSKGGKTMITRGMTVGEFERKYGLND
jgi:hypothetical protein